MTDPLFDYKEIKQLNDLERMVGELNKKYAKLQLEVSNIRAELKRERLRRANDVCM